MLDRGTGGQHSIPGVSRSNCESWHICSVPSEKRAPACYNCGSTQHKYRQCPQRKLPTESTGKKGKEVNCITGMVTKSGGCLAEGKHCSSTEGLGDQCRKLYKEWAGMEFRRMSGSYVHAAEVDAVSGSMGSFYHTRVEIASIPVEAMVDPGLSATILSFELFQSIGKQAQIPPDALKFPDIVLRDYSQ